MTVMKEARKIRFRMHAFDQLLERSCLDKSEIKDVVLNKAFICIREEKIKRYLLFYSEHDKQHYVIVQDKYNLEIITILYVDYFNHWRVPQDLLDEAEELYFKKKNKRQRIQKNQQPKIHLRIRLLDNKIVSLVSIPLSEFSEPDLETESGMKFIDELYRKHIKEKGLSEDDVSGRLVYVGKKFHKIFPNNPFQK